MKRFMLALLAGLLLVPALACAQPSSNSRDDDFRPITEQGYRYKDLVNLLKALRNTPLGNPNLTVGTNTAKVRTNNQLHYRIDNQVLTKASTDDFCTLSGTALTAVQSQYFRLEIDAAGACSFVAGRIVTTASEPTPIPARSKSKATMGLLHITNFGGGFTPGTSNVTASSNVVYTNGDPDVSDLLEK